MKIVFSPVTAVIKKLVRKVLGERRVRSLRTLLRDSSLFTQQAAVYEPGHGKVVVLAPHMDDETLGCGGTIARHAQAGAHVTVIFLTDGRHGGPSRAGMTGSERDRKQTEIIKIRKREAQCAGKILGVGSIMFLDAEDTRLHLDTRVPKLLRDILAKERPDCVYLPSFLENHADHRAASRVLFAAVAGAGLEFECRSYEVWTPLFPNRVVKIDATIELKKRALACYQSQLAQMDYLHAAIGLNAHRSLALGGMAGQFAEAFYALPLAEYLRLYRAVPASMLNAR
jgi:LmbE family N-acetylglucosaminyl deacetylase